jgi:hypothetical protein
MNADREERNSDEKMAVLEHAARRADEEIRELIGRMRSGLRVVLPEWLLEQPVVFEAFCHWTCGSWIAYTKLDENLLL